jgi:type 1 glutamine amidotransferase
MTCIIPILMAIVPAADANTPAPLRALILSGRNNHNWKATTPVLHKTLEDSKRFVADVLEDPSKMTAEMLAKCDVVVSNWCSFPKAEERAWGETAEKAFVDFVKGGKGAAFFHAGTSSFHNWPEYMKLAGGVWGKATHHGPNRQPIRVWACDANHPVAFGVRDFDAADELWCSIPVHPEAKVIFRARPTDPKAKPVAAEGEPVALCTELGKGRGFWLTLGHDAGAMSGAGWQLLMLRGTEWAATGKASLGMKDLPAPQPAEAAKAGK